MKITAVERFSPSKLLQYDKCPKQYKLERLDRIRMDDAEQPFTVFGEKLHEYAEKWDNLAFPDFDGRQFLLDTHNHPIFRNEDREAVIPTARNLRAFITKQKENHDVVQIHREREIWLKLPWIIFQGIIDLSLEFDNNYFRIVDYKTARKKKDRSNYDFQMKMYMWAMMRKFGIPADHIEFLIYFPVIDDFHEFQYTEAEINSFEGELNVGSR
jgi:CRISPR/Cas system-associated exonuclease Cas4 (RecB family)